MILNNFSLGVRLGIDGNFQKLFQELEEGHFAFQERLNRLCLDVADLKALLVEETIAFGGCWLPIMTALAEITSKFNKDQEDEHRRFIQSSRYFTIIQEAPFYWQIINKPRGYAGDARMLDFIYRNQQEGVAPLGMMLHKHAVSTETCQSVRNRKDYLREQILRKGGGDILSLAAGPAWEIKEVLDTAKEGKFHFLALDHDIETLKQFKPIPSSPYFRYALANAFQIIAGNYLTAEPRPFCEKCCSPKKDFKGLRWIRAPLKYKLEYLQKNSYELVYAAGLYDYIKTFPGDDEKGTVALTKHLFSLVKRGGTLIVGNFTPQNPPSIRFIMEYVYDWRLIYRDEEAMLDLARSIPKHEIGDIQIDTESLGINHFLRIEKA